MSAKDAPGEVKDNNIFDSPNISSSVDDIEEIVDKKAEEQKKRETVDIDGVPIEDKEIKYRASDIRKKKKMEYFVNVEGAEERAKAEEKKKEEEKKAIAKAAKDLEKEKLAEKADAEKKAVEEQKKIAEVTKYINKQKTEKARAEKKEKKQRTNKRGLFIFAGIGVVAILVIIAVTVIIPSVNQRQQQQREEEAKREEDEKYFAEFYSKPYNAVIRDLEKNVRLSESLDNYYYPDVDEIYEEASKKLTDECDLANLYIDKAARIYNHDRSEIAEMNKALEFSSVFLCEDVTTLSDLKGYFDFVGNTSKAEEIQQKIDSIVTGRPPIDDTINTPSPKDEDA